MKHLYTLLLAMVIAIGAQAQNCFWTATVTPSNVATFIPPPGFPASQYYALWNFGNGASITSNPQTPITQAYNAPGNYWVCLSMYDSLNATIVCTYCDTLVVGGAQCSATYTQNPGNPAQFSFSANLQNALSSAVWDFGDGGTGSGSNVSHTYAAPGTYTVTMSEVGGGSVLCTYTFVVVVGGGSLSCGFGYTFPSPPNTGIIQFNGISNSPSASYSWDFGDGSTGSGNNPQHTFTASGAYNVCVTVTDSTDTCNYCQMIPVNIPAGNCSFTSIQDSINPALWYFFGQPGQLTTVLNWDFGDGSTGIGPNVSHTYAAPGVYTVCMNEVELATGNIVCTSCNAITITNGTGCSFTMSSAPANPLVVSFTAAPYGGAASYVWDFGDGNTGVGLNATHTYAAPGTYNVCLSIGQFGTIVCTTCQPLVIGGVNPSCQANFVAVSVGLNAYFIDQSSVVPPNVPPLPVPVNYSWNFGDGNSSTLQFPQHQYSAPGTYLVCLTVSTVGCTSTFCDSVIIDTTTANPVGCNAYFVFTQISPYQLIGVNLSSGVNLNFSWDFGDGSPLATGPYPTHQYSNTGTYQVCLTVSDFFGCSDTYCDTLTVDSLGNIVYRGVSSVGFTLNIFAPNQLGTTGISESKVTIGSIFPVPATDHINVVLGEQVQGVVRYKVLGMDGRFIRNGSLSGQQNAIDISTLQQGIYLLEVITADGQRDSKYFVRQ